MGLKVKEAKQTYTYRVAPSAKIKAERKAKKKKTNLGTEIGKFVEQYGNDLYERQE